MHELFATSTSLQHPEVALDFLVVNGHIPTIQVVMSDEIEQTGTCQALVARGAKIVASQWSNTADMQTAFSPEADIIVVSWNEHDLQQDFDITLLINALGTGSKPKLVIICPPLAENSIREKLSRLPVASLVVSRGNQTATTLLVESTRRLLIGEYGSNIEPSQSLIPHRILEAARFIEILTFRETQILRLISSGSSNGQIAVTLGIKI